jgi:hypothetical protein
MPKLITNVLEYFKSQSEKTRLSAKICEVLSNDGETSLLRKCLITEKLPDGEAAILSRIICDAIIVNEFGQGLERLNLDGFVPQFEIADNPRIALATLRNNEDNVDRLFNTIIQETQRRMIEAEDQFLGMFFERKRNDYVEEYSEAIIQNGIQDLTKRRLTPSKILMSPLVFAMIMKIKNIKRDQLQDQLSGNSIFKQEFGLQLYLSTLCGDTSVFILPRSEELGVIYQRTNLTVLPADDLANSAVGFSVFEQLGIAFFDYMRIVKLAVNGYQRLARMRNKMSFISHGYA